MNKILMILGWIAFLCGVITYFIAWSTILGGGSVWGISTQLWFYDSIAALLIGIFLLMASQWKKQ